MVLTIFEVSSLAWDISRMESVNSPMERLARSTMVLVSCISLSASEALVAFWRVMEANSSREAEVCSIAAACWLEPSARSWLPEAIRSATKATCSELSSRSPAAKFSGMVMAR